MPANSTGDGRAKTEASAKAHDHLWRMLGEFKWLCWHGVVMLGALASLFLINRWYSGSGWFFWLTMSWGFLFAIHFLIVKSLNADEDWAYGRADDLRFKSYDHKHMNAIRGHYTKPSARWKVRDGNSAGKS